MRPNELVISRKVYNACKEHGFGMFQMKVKNPGPNQPKQVHVIRCTVCNTIIAFLR